ncbi:hypothetical protein RI129_007281 [Pyrocoelia pectoralis]|uniref:Fucosyltransferase n=1 Tax=Pyrocoelia pectoralis TaxID=417401 RepID=A0AAN7VDB9_9COLE
MIKILRQILKVRIKYILIILIVCSTFSLFIIKKYSFTTDSKKYPAIIWWTPFIFENKKIITCENSYKCLVTKNRSLVSDVAAYLFYGSNFDENDLPLPKNNIPWTIFHEESPKNLAFFLDEEGQQLFDITATFSRNSTLPLVLQYLEDLHLITDTIYYVPLKQKNELLKQLSPILYIQSDCETPIERDFYVSELMKYIRVDSYGRCLNNKHLPEQLTINKVLTNLYDEDFMKFVSQYKFTIAIENSMCNDYITEKLWRPLIAGSIPIYLGSPSVKDWLPNQHSAILIDDYKNISHLANYLKYINSNDRLYETYMAHKLSGYIENQLLKDMFKKGSYGIDKNRDFPVPAFECFVCKTVYERSYSTSNKSVYNCEKPKSNDPGKENSWISHWKYGKCQAKTLFYFIKSLNVSNYTKEIFNKQIEFYLNNDYC